MFNHKKNWKEIPYTMFVDEVGEGKQLCLINTRYIRVYRQKFSSSTVVKFHHHDYEWEIVLRLGLGICLSIYPPKMDHCLFGPSYQQDKWWSILSIKIGRKP